MHGSSAIMLIDLFLQGSLVIICVYVVLLHLLITTLVLYALLYERESVSLILPPFLVTSGLCYVCYMEWGMFF